MTIVEMYETILSIPSDIQLHLMMLRSYSTQCRSVVELGVRNGFSTIALLAGKPDIMHSYDITLTPRAKEIYLQAQTEGMNFHLLEGSSLEITIPECNLLFIDTLHVGEVLFKELAAHAPYVKEYIILHDTVVYGLIGGGEQGIIVGSEGLMFGLIPFLRENRQWRVKEHFTHNNGLTILERV